MPDPMFFTTYLLYFGLYDIYYNTDTKLDDLESSEAQKWLVKWILKNILIIAYFRPGLPPQLVINDNTLLIYGSAGLALTTVWIPCVKNSPMLTILLMILHVICFVIGPFNTFRRFLRGGYRQYSRIDLLNYLLLIIGVFGKQSSAHFFNESVTPIDFTESHSKQFTKFLGCCFVPQTAFEFVRVESVLSVIVFRNAIFS
ncbi:hypothetical protein CRE_15592 [Caenorhabditis remanei]|uniref:Uncharacterized protein n=1 Tax=Caenorhabditis remanei TaxID=31234 RepID=E3N2M3_CAERE|nr:hypothetical protein CRE_15592 [Caenorhabditis remanei]